MLLSPIFTAHYQGQLLGRNWTLSHFVYGGITLSAGPFQATSTVFWKSVIAAAKHHISRRIQFGLFPFRSPLLGKSLLISLPRGTKMLQFPRFNFQYQRTGIHKSVRFSFGNLGIIGCVRLPRAYHSLPCPSSLLKPSNPPIGVFTLANSATYYTTMHDDH